MDKLREGLGNLKELMIAIVKFQTGQIDAHQLAAAAGTDPPRASLVLRANTPGARSQASSEPDPFYNSAEANVMRIFPINVYTEAVDWMLQQTVVQNFVYHEMLRRQYVGLPTTKPDFEIVLFKLIKYTLSIRLQCHLGKMSTKTRAGGKNLDVGRFPMPAVMKAIAEGKVSKLHKVKIEGQRSTADFFLEKTGNAKRTFLIGSDQVAKAPSVQALAQWLYWERMDFVRQHMVSDLIEKHSRR